MSAEDEAMYRRTMCQSVGRHSTINRYVTGIDAVHDDIDANNAEVDVGDDAQRRRVRKELVNHEIERLEKLGVRDERPAASMKA